MHRRPHVTRLSQPITALERWRAALAERRAWAKDYSDPRTLAACSEAQANDAYWEGAESRAVQRIRRYEYEARLRPEDTTS